MTSEIRKTQTRLRKTPRPPSTPTYKPPPGARQNPAIEPRVIPLSELKLVGGPGLSPDDQAIADLLNAMKDESRAVVIACDDADSAQRKWRHRPVAWKRHGILKRLAQCRRLADQNAVAIFPKPSK